MFTKIKRVLRFTGRQISLNRRLTQEELEQKKEGYQIKLINGYGRHFILYREDNKRLILDNQGTWDNNTTLSSKALEYWCEPRGEKLSEIECERAKNRIIKFLSCWGDVILDNLPVRTVNEIVADLNSRGIDLHKLEDTNYGHS